MSHDDGVRIGEQRRLKNFARVNERRANRAVRDDVIANNLILCVQVKSYKVLF